MGCVHASVVAFEKLGRRKSIWLGVLTTLPAAGSWRAKRFDFLEQPEAAGALRQIFEHVLSVDPPSSVRAGEQDLVVTVATSTVEAGAQPVTLTVRPPTPHVRALADDHRWMQVAPRSQ